MKYLRLVLLLFNCVPFFVFSQTPKELKNDAQKLFDNQQFVEATPLFSRLLAIEPKNHIFNFNYGTCLLFQSNDKQKALNYLVYAVKSSEVPDEAFFYLGRAYHINYAFKDAIKAYTKFVTISSNTLLKQDAERNIKMCQNGKNKLNRLTAFEVLDKQEIATEDFYRSYSLTEFGGELIVVSEFQSKLDKKRKHVPLVYFGTGALTIYYASYGEDGSTGLDIYMRKKNKTIGWSEPEKLGANINSAQDENFPFFNDKTKELFFSSNGYESIGGFDIFKAKFVRDGQFEKPKILDFAISSSEDDVLYISDSLDQVAYFASNRNCEAGKTMLYKIKNQRYLQNDQLVKGDFVSSTASSIAVQVFEQNSGKLIGQFSTNENKGFYFLFPSAGKYLYQCKIANQTTIIPLKVDIPTLANRLPLAQYLYHEIVSGEDRLSFVNKDSLTEETSADLLATIIRQKADLETTKTPLLGQKLINDAISEVTNELIEERQQKAAQLQNKIKLKKKAVKEIKDKNNQLEQNFDYLLYQKNTDLVNSNNTLKALIVSYNNEKNKDKKEAFLQEASNLVAEIKKKEIEKDALLVLKKKSLSTNIQAEKELEKLENEPIIMAFLSTKSDVVTTNVSPDEQAKIEQYLAINFSTRETALLVIEDSLSALQQKMQQAVLLNSTQISSLQSTIQSLEQQLQSSSQKENEKIESQLNSEQLTLNKYQEDQAIVQKKFSLYQDKLNEIRTEKASLLLVFSTSVPSTIDASGLAKKSQQNVEAGNSQTLQDFVALTVQKNPLSSPVETLSKKLQNEEVLHAQKVQELLKSNSSEKAVALVEENKRFEKSLNLLEEKYVSIDVLKLSAAEKALIESSLQTIQTLKINLSPTDSPSNSSTTSLDQKQMNLIAQEELNQLTTKNRLKKASIKSNESLNPEEKVHLINLENDSLLTQLNQFEKTLKEKQITNSSYEKSTILKEIEELKQQVVIEKSTIVTSINQATSNGEISVQKIQQKVHDLIENHSIKRNKIANNALLETPEKEQLLELERDSLLTQLNQFEKILKVEQITNSSPENITLLTEIDDFRQQIGSQNSSENIDTSNVYSLSVEKNVEDSVPSVLLENQSSAEFVQKFQTELYELEEKLRLKNTSLQALPIEESNEIIQRNDAAFRNELLEKRNEISSSKQSISLKNNLFLGVDSLLAVVDQRLKERYQENKKVLEQFSTEKSLIFQKQQLKKLTNDEAIVALLYGESQLSAQQQLEVINQFTSLLRSEQLKQKKLAELQPIDLTIQSNNFFLAQIDKRLGDLKESISDETKSAKIESNTPLQKEKGQLSDAISSASSKDISDYILQVRGAFKSKESLSFSKELEPDLLKLKRIEWKRYLNYLENIITNEKATNELNSEKSQRLLTEISSAKENIVILTTLLTSNEIKSIPVKPILPTNSVLKFGNPLDTANESTSFIPLDVEIPKGLLYRVQIGAFTNQMVAGNHPSIEPISGERMRNGWYRYLSGYFGDFENALLAQTYVRENGFSDAYLVAYCDGEKITLQQARDYTANGSCVPYASKPFKVNQNASVEVDNGTIITNLSDQKTTTNLPEASKNQSLQSAKRYFESPTAVSALPIEDLKGLLFTVQIGAFLVPATAQITKGLTPLFTYLLPNKNIRYSVGIFTSLVAANQTKKEAISKGFKDAFIVAYYNGERISNQAALQIINSSNFEGFANLNQAVNTDSAVENIPEISNQIELKEQVEEIQITEKNEVLTEEKSYQFISKKSFSTYPRDVLNRYNNKGYFYYDASDGKVKSTVFASKDELPKIYTFKNDIDTLEINLSQTAPTSVIMFNFASNHLSGALVDWLQRLSMRVEFTQIKDEINVSIYGIKPTQEILIEEQLKQFELDYTFDKK